jgi:hypothetical protein
MDALHCTTLFVVLHTNARYQTYVLKRSFTIILWYLHFSISISVLLSINALALASWFCGVPLLPHPYVHCIIISKSTGQCFVWVCLQHSL